MDKPLNRLTDPQRRVLSRLARGDQGALYGAGKRVASGLASRGLLKADPHWLKYTITEAGEAALAEQEVAHG